LKEEEEEIFESLKIFENLEEKLTSLKFQPSWLFIGSVPLALPPKKEHNLSHRI